MLLDAFRASYRKRGKHQAAQKQISAIMNQLQILKGSCSVVYRILSEYSRFCVPVKLRKIRIGAIIHKVPLLVKEERTEIGVLARSVFSQLKGKLRKSVDRRKAVPRLADELISSSANRGTAFRRSTDLRNFPFS